MVLADHSHDAHKKRLKCIYFCRLVILKRPVSQTANTCFFLFGIPSTYLDGWIAFTAKFTRDFSLVQMLPDYMFHCGSRGEWVCASERSWPTPFRILNCLNIVNLECQAPIYLQSEPVLFRNSGSLYLDEIVMLFISFKLHPAQNVATFSVLVLLAIIYQ